MTVFDPFSTTVAAGTSVLGTIATLGTQIKAVMEVGQQKSLIELSSPGRVEPVTIVGADCINYPDIDQVTQSMLSIFSGYYLQAVNAVCSLKTAQVLKNLDRLNPNRTSPFTQGLAQLGSESINSMNKWKLSFESVEEQAEKDKGGKSTTEFKNIDVLKENANLSVGKLVEVSINEGTTVIKFPLAIRLMVAPVPDETIATILTATVQDNSFLERWHGWRSGRLSFVKDLLLASDLIEEQKKAMMKDKTGVYADIIARANKNKISALFSGQQTLNSASYLYVMSEVSAAQIEERGNGKFADKHFRDKVFESGYAMIIAVVDRQYDRVKFYHRGMAQVTNLHIRELKSANKGNGIDVYDVMKAFVAGNSPAF